MTIRISPIPTRYAGRSFRSRLEARWAVFYDTLGIPWTYEPEGYDLGDKGPYLPDFWLPGLRCFIEIKPVKPIEAEIQKAIGLAEQTKSNVFIFFGSMPGYAHAYREAYPSGQVESDSAYRLDCGGAMDQPYVWCVCQQCGKFGIEYEGRSDRVCGHNSTGRGYSYGDPRLHRAYDTANSFRFER
jgi:hypothetical protein